LEKCRKAYYEADSGFLRMTIPVALGALGTEDCVPLLIDALLSNSGAVSGSAAIALGRIGPSASMALPVLHNNISSGFDISTTYALDLDLRLHMIDSIRRIGSPESIYPLTKTLLLIHTKGWSHSKVWDDKRNDRVSIPRSVIKESRAILNAIVEISYKNPAVCLSKLYRVLHEISIPESDLRKWVERFGIRAKRVKKYIDLIIKEIQGEPKIEVSLNSKSFDRRSFYIEFGLCVIVSVDHRS
jgi:hypothetical protein